ncbi:MAG: NAD(P)H-dependent oxidoreductase [Aeromonas veronii]
MKKWLDEVFAYSFAYGPGGDMLNNKKVILSMTFAVKNTYMIPKKMQL